MPAPATFVLITHFLVVAYIVLGFPIGLILNHRKFRLIHSGALAFISSLMVFKIPCPLTVLEKQLGSAYIEESFIAYWLKQIIYLPWMGQRTVFLIDMFFAVLVFSSFYWKPLPPKKTTTPS